MSQTARGFYRTKGGEGLSDDAWVTDGTIGMDVPEARYRERGYVPEFDKLPWKDEYEAAEKAKTSKLP